MADVRNATAAEIPKLAATLASAFSNDPVFVWLTPERNREDRLRRFFAQQLAVTIGHDGVFTTDDYGGVAIWLPPDNWKIATGDLVRSMPAMVRSFGSRLPRVLGGLGVIEKSHPTDVPHLYLEFLRSPGGGRADCRPAGKISEGTPAPPSWLASCAVFARAETRTMTPIPSAATAGATQKMTTAHSRVGTMIRWVTGHAAMFVVNANATKPTHDTATAGRNAPSTLATNSRRSEIGRRSSVSSDLRCLSP